MGTSASHTFGLCAPSVLFLKFYGKFVSHQHVSLPSSPPQKKILGSDSVQEDVFESRQRLEILPLFQIAHTGSLAHPPSHKTPLSLVIPPGTKRLLRKSDHPPSSSDKFKNEWSCISTSQYVFVAYTETALTHWRKQNITFFCVYEGIRWVFPKRFTAIQYVRIQQAS